MISSQLIDSTETDRNLDISKIKFDKDGVIDFYWPLDNKKSAEVMELITSELIPYVTDNERKYSELVAVRLLFKWFICEILRIFEATVLASECKKDFTRPHLPEHYKKFDAIYNSKELECVFFLKQSFGPPIGRKMPRLIKRCLKEFIWNGMQFGLLRKYGSNPNDILAIAPSNLAIRHAKGAKKLLRYSGFDEWFGSVPSSHISKESEGLVGLENVLSIVKKSFSRTGYEISRVSVTYLTSWINQANNFVDYHLDNRNDLLNKITGDVWFGCGASSVWHVMMIEKLRRKNIKVVTHDHGSGNSHHEQTPVHWVEFMHTDHFVTFNRVNETTKNSQFRRELIFGQKSPLIQSLDSALGIKSSHTALKVVKTSKRIKKIMYVGTAFHGEGARLRPIFHDVTYFDWQIKLLSHLKKLNMDVIYKPHPEGATRVPNGFAESFGFQSNTKRFEEINDNIDAYILDFLFSSTTPIVLKTDKPVFFINLGFPELNPEALDLIKKRCYYLKAHYSTDSRLSIDFNEFDQLINNEEHVFNTSFPDVYFSNA